MSYLFLILIGLWLLYRVTQNGGKISPPPTNQASMTRENALEVLGLSAGATKEEIQQAYQNLLKKLHPDTGGSDHLTQQIINAKRVLDGE